MDLLVCFINLSIFFCSFYCKNGLSTLEVNRKFLENVFLNKQNKNQNDLPKNSKFYT